MDLLSEEKLIWSAVVANNRMNRQRNASGVNSYEQELKFKPEEFLERKVKEHGQAAWLDVCCGQGIALLQTAKYIKHAGIDKYIKLKGIDLIGDFVEPDTGISFLQFERKSILKLAADEKYDLITCVHGLHYVGDKLKAIEIAVSSLSDTGLFIANLDLNNISVQTTQRNFLQNMFNGKGLIYSRRLKLLKSFGRKEVAFHLQYLGADDTYGPNYTGQESITSHYVV